MIKTSRDSLTHLLPPPKGWQGIPSRKDKEVEARARQAVGAPEASASLRGPEESESSGFSEGPEVRAGLEKTRGDSPWLMTAAHDTGRRTRQPRCRVP